MSKLNRVYLHTAQHPFHDVAVVAEQPARGFGVVAVIGAHLAPVKGAKAHGAAVTLEGEQLGEKPGIHAGSVDPLPFEAFAPTFGVCLELLAQFLGTGLGLLALRVLRALRPHLRAGVVRGSAGLHLGPGVVLPQPGLFPFFVRQTAQAVVLKVRRPLLWGTF